MKLKDPPLFWNVKRFETERGSWDLEKFWSPSSILKKFLRERKGENCVLEKFDPYLRGKICGRKRQFWLKKWEFVRTSKNFERNRVKWEGKEWERMERELGLGKVVGSILILRHGKVVAKIESSTGRFLSKREGKGEKKYVRKEGRERERSCKNFVSTLTLGLWKIREGERVENLEEFK